MKRTNIFIMLLLGWFLSACATGESGAEPTAMAIPEDSLLVTGESIKIAFSHSDLKAFPESQADYAGVTYVGIPMSRLLKAALFDPEAVKSVKAVSGDGKSVSFGTKQIIRQDFLIAYTTTAGELPAADGQFVLIWTDAGVAQVMPRLIEVQVSE